MFISICIGIDCFCKGNQKSDVVQIFLCETQIFKIPNEVGKP